MPGIRRRFLKKPYTQSESFFFNSNLCAYIDMEYVFYIYNNIYLYIYFIGSVCDEIPYPLEKFYK